MILSSQTNTLYLLKKYYITNVNLKTSTNQTIVNKNVIHFENCFDFQNSFKILKKLKTNLLSDILL